MTAPTGTRLGRHTLVYAAGILLSRAVSFVLLPLYTRFLTPADYGVMQLVDLTLDVVAILAGAQMAGGVFRFYHKAETEADRRAVLASGMTMLAGSFVVFAAATLAAAAPLARLALGSANLAGLIRIAAVSLGLQGFVVVPFAYLRLREQSTRFTYVNIGRLVVQLTLNIVLVAGFRAGVRGILLSTLITNALLAIVLGAPFVARVGVRVTGPWLRALLRYGLPLVGVNVATFIATFGDRYFLRASADMTAVGLYALAYQFGFLLLSIGYMPFSLVWEPVRFEIAKRPDRDAVLARVFVIITVLLVSLTVAMTLFVGDFLTIMSDPSYYGAARLVPIILIAYVLQGWTSLHDLGLLVTERTELLTLANWVAALAALAGYALLIPRWYGLGAAIATVVAFALRYLVTFALSQRLWPVRYDWAPVARLAIAATPFCVIALVVPRLPLAWSLVLHSGLFAAYGVALWNADVLARDDRIRLSRCFHSPRQFMATLVT